MAPQVAPERRPATRPERPARARRAPRRRAPSRSTTATASRTGASSSPAFRRWRGCRSTSTAPTPPRPAHRDDGLRLPGLAARRVRPRARAQRGTLRRARRVPRARRQRGARRDGRLGQPARGDPARRALRRRDRHLVRQGARRRPRGRRAAPRQRGRASSRTGGALALAGDDPAAKSSTLPNASESLLAALHIPVLFPGDVQEVLDFGLHALALSRASGLWAGLKVVTAVADATGTALVAPGRVVPSLPSVEWRGAPVRAPPRRAPAAAVLARARGDDDRPAPRARARLRARERPQPRSPAPRDAWLGIVAAGKSRHDLAQALADLGLDDARARPRRRPLPPPGDDLAARARGGRGFARRPRRDPRRRGEAAVRRGAGARHPLRPGRRPARHGQARRAGRPLLSGAAELDADAIARAVAARLGSACRIDSAERAHPQPRPTRPPRRPRAAAGPRRRAHAVLLLRLPAQQLDPRPRRRARRRGHRLSHDGAAQPRRAAAT